MAENGGTNDQTNKSDGGKKSSSKRSVASKPQSDQNDSTAMSDTERLAKNFSDNTKKLVDKITNEGQLLRNTGTNSIRSIGLRLDKFNDTFKSINSEMEIQTSILKNILNETYIEHDRLRNIEIQNRIQESEDREDRKRRDKEPKNNPKPIMDKNGSGSSFMGVLGALGPLLAIAALPLRVIAAMGGMVAADLAGEFLESAFYDYEIDKIPILGALLEPIIEPLKSGMLWGAIGRAFSKKLGLYGLIAGGAFTFANNMLDNFDLNIDLGFLGLQLGDMFGAIITGSVIYLTKNLAAGKGASLAATAAANIAGGGSDVARDAARRGFLSKIPFLRNGLLSIATGIVGTLAASALGSAADAMGAPEDMVADIKDSANFVVTSATYGAMFGPTGMLAGAAIGLTWVIGEKLISYITNSRGVIEDKMQDAQDILQKQLENEDFVLSSMEKTGLISSLQEAERIGDKKVVEAINKILTEDASRTPGLEIVDVARNQNVADYIRENKEDLTGQFDNIQYNNDLTEQEKIDAAQELIRELASKFPDMEAIDFGRILSQNIGNTSFWTSNDGKGLLSEIMRNPYDLGVNFSSGITDPDLEYHAIRQQYENERGEEFLPNDEDVIAWMRTNPRAQEFFNKMLNINGNYGMEQQPVFVDTGNAIEDLRQAQGNIAEIVRNLDLNAVDERLQSKYRTSSPTIINNDNRTNITNTTSGPVDSSVNNFVSSPPQYIGPGIQ